MHETHNPPILSTIMGTKMLQLAALVLALLATACVSDDDAPASPDAGDVDATPPPVDAVPDAHPTEIATRELYLAECTMISACATFRGEDLAARAAVCADAGIGYRCDHYDCTAELDAETAAKLEQCIAAYDERTAEALSNDYSRCGLSSYPEDCAALLPR